MPFALRWLVLTLGILGAVALVILGVSYFTGARVPGAGRTVFVVAGVALTSAVVLISAKPARKSNDQKDSS